MASTKNTTVPLALQAETVAGWLRSDGVPVYVAPDWRDREVAALEFSEANGYHPAPAQSVPLAHDVHAVWHPAGTRLSYMLGDGTTHVVRLDEAGQQALRDAMGMSS